MAEGLKKSIVIKNEFSVKSKATGKGSRGSTPGNYVYGYMARNHASEGITPVTLFDGESYIMRYMRRESAVDTALSPDGLKLSMQEGDGFGGQAFGYGDVSLSDEKLRACSRDIQEQYEKGKTVFKTVLSFDNEYLQAQRIVPEGFVPAKRGDYRGNVDQMRLRLAIMHGIDRISPDYDDLRYVGVIQVDTMHVHCHLAMVDAGRGIVLPNGEQKGMLSARQRFQLRRGIDLSLDQEKSVQHLSQDVQSGERNALCYLKKYTHKMMDHNGPPQFLLACLPADKRLWRADTNRKEMRKPNAIVRDFVMQVLDEPDSGYKEALREMDRYARLRQEREGFSDDTYRQLYRNGQERLIASGMNSVYGVLKEIPESEKQVRTPLLDVMSQDYEEMAAEAESDPMVEFGFRLRSCSSRLDHHKKETHKWRDLRKTYEKVEDPNPAAAPLLQFIQNEETYNAKLMCKYQYFLGFLPPEDEWSEEFEGLMKYRDKMKALSRMRKDKSLLRMKPENAETYGVRVYGQHGGRFALSSPQILEARQERMAERYAKKEQDFKDRLLDYGLALSEKDGTPAVVRQKPWSFDDVKALDIHHMAYDFAHDVPVSMINVRRFAEEANRRFDLYQQASDYLKRSGQSDRIDYLPGRDIALMKETADKLAGTGMLVSSTAAATGGRRAARTTSLDVDYTQSMQDAVKRAVSGLSFGE